LTGDQFRKLAEDYYCSDYTDTQRHAVREWLSMRREEEISFIWAEVLKLLSPKYKTPPCITELEEAWKIVKRERWDELQKRISGPKHKQIAGPVMSNEEWQANCQKVREKIREVAAAKKVREDNE
jgi:hypothetical protein